MKKILRIFSGFAVFCCFVANMQAQVNIKVTVVSVGATLDDCDSGIFGIGDSGSDPNYSWTGADIDNRCFEFECNNNQNCATSGTIAISKVLYDQSFSCPSNIPASLSWGFRGRENDTPIACLPEPPGGSGSLNGAIIDATHSCPLGGVVGTSTYSFTEATTSGCNGTMSYTVTVEVTGAFPPPVPDLVCNAQVLPVDGTYRNFAWCGNYTYETGEFSMTTPGWLGDAHGSGWFSFVAPASGSVAIETSTQATSIGTAFLVYHAADGAGCGTGHGTSASGVVLKRKFQYLSSYDDADDDIPLIDPEAAANIDMNSCSNIFSDGHDLVGGEVYYIQMTSDANNASGNIAIRVRDLGGSGSNLSDIPCQSPGAGLLTSSNYSTSLSHGCSTNYEFTGNGGTSAYTYLDPTGGTNNINESNWVNFVAPNSGAAYIEANVPVLGENAALYAFDARFAPGRPNDYSCADLVQTQYGAGTAAIFGASASVFSAYCLEPGYTYFAMADPTQIALSGSTNFLLRDPNSAAPANDILCLTLQNPAYNVPVRLLGASPIAPINGDNTNACIERLAGEPGFQNAADKTVWHYFTAPASGVVNVTVQAGTIGQVAVAVFNALNGNACYGGLAPATFTTDGTPTSPRITALGGANGGGNVLTQVCCLTPGAKYLVEIDGATTLSEGTYNIKIDEVEVRGGLTAYVDTDGDTYNALSPTPALICSGESVTASSSAAILPNGGCLSEGFILHNQAAPVAPYSNLTVYQQATPGNQFFINNGTAPYNTPIYVSALADNQANWGNRCASARIQDAVAVVFLQPIVFQTPIVTVCGSVRLQVGGGLPAYNSSAFTYTISPAGSLSTVASGTVSNNGFLGFTATVAGNYTVFVSDGEGCQRSTTINIPSVSIVTTSISGGTAICSGISTTLTATGGSTYQWTLPDNTTALGASLSANIDGVYTVTATNAVGCTASATRTIVLLAAAIAPSITQINPLCAVGNGLLDAGANYANYAWNTTATTQTIVVTTPATYTVTVTNTVGCTATGTFALSANPNPNAPLIATSNTSICGNGFISLDAANANFTTYKWSLNNSTGSNLVVTAAGIYTVTVSDAVGCTASSTIAITQNPIPAAPSATQTAPFCPNSAGIVNVVAPLAGAVYTWSNGTSGTSTSVSASGTLSLTITTTGNCSNSSSININANSLPIAPSIVQVDSLCANANGRIDAGIGYASYLWNGGQTAPQIVVNTNGTYTVTVTNAAGCSIASSIVVARQAAVVAPTFAQASLLCDNRATTLNAIGTGYTAYNWSNNATTSSINVATAGNYTLTVTNAAGCTNTAIYNMVSFNAPAPPSLTITRFLCATGTGTIAAQGGFAAYAWAGGTPNSTTFEQTISAIGNYTVTVTDANTCTRSNNINVQQAATPAVPGIRYKGVFCAGSPVTLVADAGFTSYNWGGTNTADTLQITGNGVYTVTVSNQFGCTNTGVLSANANALPTAPDIQIVRPLCVDKTTELIASGGSAAYIWSNGSFGQTASTDLAGVYTVTITDAVGCTNTRSTVVTLEAPTLVTITGGTFFCSGNSLNIGVNAAFDTYVWNTNEATNGINIVDSGVYSVTATATNGCTGTASVTIIERTLPNASAGSMQTIYIGETAQLAASGGGTYLWNTDATLSTLTDAVTTASPNNTTTYTVLVSNSFGCTKTSSVTVEVLDTPDCLKTNEGVTPNGDGYNDTWKIPCLQYFPNTLQIINRWGQTIFTATNYNNDFDGIYEGKEQPDGTYYYIINYTTRGATRTLKGTITVLR